VFIARLETLGVEVKGYFTGDEVVGIAFALGGVTCNGFRLDRALSWQGLRRVHGLNYEAARYLPALRAATARAKSFVVPRGPVG
jgi:hypothetical protein